MSIDHNRIKVADLEKNQPNKILTTNFNGELVFSDNYNALDCVVEGKVLDARQGKELKDLIENINVSVSLPIITVSSNVPTGVPGDGDQWITYSSL